MASATPHGVVYEVQHGVPRFWPFPRLKKCRSLSPIGFFGPALFKCTILDIICASRIDSTGGTKVFSKRLAIAVLVAATMAEAGRDVPMLVAKAQTHLRVENQTTEHGIKLWFLKVLRLTK